MTTSYSGEKIINRQRICIKCKGFVTHDKVADDQFACALCSHRIDSSPKLAPRTPVTIIAQIVENQHLEREAQALKAPKPVPKT